MYGSWASCNVILIQRDGNSLFRVVSYCTYNTEDRDFEIRLKLFMSESITKILFWIYQWLIVLKIAEIYSSKVKIWWTCLTDMHQPFIF